MKYLVVFFVAISGAISVQAVYFSEIMYDPVGADSPHEWIEIYNDTNSPVNFTSWKFFEGGTNHGITGYSGITSVSAGEYAIIADNAQQFSIDYPSYQGVLYDSSFSLSNSGEQLVLKDGALTAIDTLAYNTTLGGNNDSSTISKIEGAWVRGSATPGSLNQSLPLESGSSGTNGTTTENQVTISQMSPPSADIVLYMPFEKTVVAGAEVEFNTYGMTRGGKNIEGLTATWAFGDGGRGVGTTTKYSYTYPGRYIAQVEGTNSFVAGIGRMMVRVVPPDIVITKIGTGKYGTYVDIFNPNTYELDFSQWKLLIDGNPFPFPKNTLIGGNTTTRFSGLAMGFASTTVSSSTIVRILFPNLEEVTSFAVNTGVNNSSTVLGTSTTVNTSTLTKTVVTRPVKMIREAPVIQKIATTTQINQTKSRSTRDTRIVAFFKSLFVR